MTDPNAPSAIPSGAGAGADARASAARQRLDRLDGFLREDPTNQTLLIDAFETALSCGEWERAHFHLLHGQTLQSDPLAWALREGDFWLAQRRYDEATAVLEALGGTLRAPAGFAEVLLHNLAYVDLRRAHYGDCIARLAPALEQEDAAPASTDRAIATRALQQLWLRALHHDGQLTRAVAWALKAESRGRLDAHAAGVASLIAFDVGDFANAQRWAAAGSAGGAGADAPAEALVTQASLALAAGDSARALQLSDAALQRQSNEGRAWSARGFASLLAGELVEANRAFARALSLMADHIGTWHGLGWTQIQLGDLPGARASFEAALALDRNFAESHGGLAVVLAMQQSRPDAEAHAGLALKLDKSNLSGRYASALLSGEVKEANDLRRLARRLLGGRQGPLGGEMADLIPPEVH